MSELGMPDEWAPELDCRAIAQDFEGQVANLLRRCLAAEGATATRQRWRR